MSTHPGRGLAAAATSPTARMAAGKLAAALASLAPVLLLGFFLFRLLPGDPATTMTRGRPITPTQLAALRHRMGLDQPLWRQLLTYTNHTLHGDLGVSFEYRRPVAELIAARLAPTLLLTGAATLIAAALGIWLGARAGWRPGSRADTATTTIALTLWSTPTFWLGMILLALTAGPLAGLLPTGGMRDPDTPPGPLPAAIDLARHLTLPCLTLVAVLYAQYTLVTRSSVLAERGGAYLTTARAKGLRDDLVRRRHALPNALLPTVNLLFLNLGAVVGGAITVEAVFSWPGLGSLTYQALSVPDLPVLQGVFLVLSTAVVAMNLLADLACHLLDPRSRTT